LTTVFFLQLIPGKQPFVTPAPVYVGEPILLTALVSEAGLPVKGCTVTVEATAPGGAVFNLVLPDDGAHEDGEANDGEYARRFTQTFATGIYHFKFRAEGISRDGQKVVREAVRDKPVLKRGAPDPNCKGQTGRKPEDGKCPPKKDCCEELLRQIGEQNQLLRRLIGRSGERAENDGENSE
jgi:hypothetical protein